MAQTTTMSINRALATIKALKVDIAEYFNTTRRLLGLQVGDAGKETNVTGMDAAKLSSVMQSDYDTINNMIERHIKIKQAIQKKNNETIVTVNGREMTVADAIILKNNLTEKENFLAHLRKVYTATEREITKIQSSFKERVDALIAASTAPDASSELRIEIATRIRAEQEALFGPRVLDPINIASVIEALDKEIREVKLELDYTLSSSNTVTTIEVDI